MKQRRGRGEGSVFQRQDGLWCGLITVGYTDTGRRRRRAVYGSTKAAVLEELTRVQHQALTGTLGDPSRLTVAEFLSQWLEAARPSLRPATQALYGQVIRLHVAPYIGGVRLTRLTSAHLQGLLAALEQAGIGAPTRQVTFRALHRALKQGVAWNLLARNPASSVIRPKVAQREMQPWTPQQARVFLDAAAADRLHALYAVLLGCGMRIGEALALSWSDWDPQRGTLTIRRQLTELAGHLHFAEPKTERGRRTVTLPGFAASALHQHRAQMQAEGHEVNRHLLIFVDTAGNPIRRSNLRRRSFASVLRRAGLRCRLHDLRHACASLHLRQGTSPVVVQQMLGHSRVSVTLDRYSHALPVLQEEAAAKLDALLVTPLSPVGARSQE